MNHLLLVHQIHPTQLHPRRRQRHLDPSYHRHPYPPSVPVHPHPCRPGRVHPWHPLDPVHPPLQDHPVLRVPYRLLEDPSDLQLQDLLHDPLPDPRDQHPSQLQDPDPFLAPQGHPALLPSF